MNNFAKIRKESNLTQTELSSRIGICQRTYANYESGHAEPNIETLIKIANALNVTVDYLIGASEQNFTPIKAESEIEKVYNRLNERNKSKALAYISGLLVVQGSISPEELANRIG